MVELSEHPEQVEAAEHLVEEVRQRLLEEESTANTITGALHCTALQGHEGAPGLCVQTQGQQAQHIAD